MNLYLVLALALGAVSAAPAAQVRATNVVRLECGSHAAALLSPKRRHGRRTPKPQRPARRSPLAARIVNTGAASPRAPASRC